MNVACLTGRVTRTPETRTVGETTIADIDVACTRTFKDKNTGNYESDFFRVKAFGNTAKFVEKYITKGIKIEIEGSLQQERWTDKEGRKRERVVISANNIRFAESKSSSNASQAQATSPTQAQQTTTNDTGFMDIPDGTTEESLPFV